MPTFLRFPKTWLGVNKPLWTRKERICKRNWKFVISHPKRLLEVSNLKKKKRAVCLNFNPVDEFRWIFEYILWCWYHDSLRRDWVIKSNDDSLEKNAKLIPRSIYVYIYIQNHKRPRHHPESSGYFNQKKVDCATRDHTFNHPFEQTASICTRNPSRWNTSRSRSSRGTLFVINSLQLTSFAPMEFTVLGDRPEREREGRKIIPVAVRNA